MGIEANKAIVRRYVELYNTGHVELWSNQDTLGWLQQLGLELIWEFRQCLQLEQCWIAGEVPLDRYDKGTRTERVQIRSMYSVELAQTGKIERTVI